MAWVVVGAGVVGLAGGAVFGVLRNGSQDRLAELQAAGSTYAKAMAEQETMEGHALAANVSFVAGGLMTAGGVALLLMADPPEDASSVVWAAPPLVGGAGAWAAIAW